MKSEVNSEDSRFDKSARIAEIEQEISAHSILSHPFLEGLRNGQFSKPQIAEWISQQYYFSNQFPRCLAALYARIEDTAVSLPLMRFLSIEHWGSRENSAHWKQFIETLRYFDQDVQKSDQHEETKEYLDYRLLICLSKPLEEGLGAVALGHEFVNVHIFEAYLRGMEKLPDVPAGALALQAGTRLWHRQR